MSKRADRIRRTARNRTVQRLLSKRPGLMRDALRMEFIKIARGIPCDAPGGLPALARQMLIQSGLADEIQKLAEKRAKFPPKDKGGVR